MLICQVCRTYSCFTLGGDVLLLLSSAPTVGPNQERRAGGSVVLLFLLLLFMAHDAWPGFTGTVGFNEPRCFTGRAHMWADPARGTGAIAFKYYEYLIWWFITFLLVKPIHSTRCEMRGLQ